MGQIEKSALENRNIDLSNHIADLRKMMKLSAFLKKPSTSFKEATLIKSNSKSRKRQSIANLQASASKVPPIPKSHRSNSTAKLSEGLPKGHQPASHRDNPFQYSSIQYKPSDLPLQRSMLEISNKKLGNCMINNLYFIPKSRRSSHGVQSMTKLKTEVNFASMGTRASKQSVPSYLMAKFSPQTKVQFTPTVKKCKSRR